MTTREWAGSRNQVSSSSDLDASLETIQLINN